MSGKVSLGYDDVAFFPLGDDAVFQINTREMAFFL